MRYFALLLLLPMILFCKDIEDEQWFQLEKEVHSTPFTPQMIDSIRESYNVKEVVKGRYIPTNLPKDCKAVYNINWGAANAGFAIIEDHRDDTYFYISGKMITNRFISAFYKVRDFVYTVGDASGLYPNFFEQHISEKDYRKERWTLYDHTNSKLYKMNGNNLEEDSLVPFSNNYMSILYNLRNSEMRVGDTLHFPTFVHGKNYDIAVAVLKKEKIKVPAGEFKTVKVRPILVGEGHGFNSKDKMFLWFSDDDKRIFIKGKVKIKLGNIYANLDHLEL